MFFFMNICCQAWMLIAIVAFSHSNHFCCPKSFFFHLGSGSQMLLFTRSVTNYIGFFCLLFESFSGLSFARWDFEISGRSS